MWLQSHGMGSPQSRRATLAFACLLLAGTVAACSDTGSARGSEGDEPDPDSAASAPAPEDFTGPVEDFYAVPDPLPAGRARRPDPHDADRGAGGRGRPAGHVPLDRRRGRRPGRHRASSTTRPRRPATRAGRSSPGHTAPSAWPRRAPRAASRRFAAAFGVHGVRVATDYIGLGPDGELHPYLSAAAEGHAVIDGVAAPRPSRPRPTPATGWSSSGTPRAATPPSSTGEMAAERLPEADLLGTVAIAPGAAARRDLRRRRPDPHHHGDGALRAAAEDPDIDPRDFLCPRPTRPPRAWSRGHVPRGDHRPPWSRWPPRRTST